VSKASPLLGILGEALRPSLVKEPMTYEEAVNLKSFKHYCTCGGFAHQMNGRDPNNPHMSWCPQDEEYREYRAALSAGPKGAKK